MKSGWVRTLLMCAGSVRLAGALALLAVAMSGCRRSSDGVSRTVAATRNASADSVPAEPAPEKHAPEARGRITDRSVRLVGHTAAADDASLSSATVPSWAADAVFYQIFP